jgi:hypothetical protein
MDDEQHNLGLGQPSAELELTSFQHRAEKLAFENKMLRAMLDSMPDDICGLRRDRCEPTTASRRTIA